MRRRVWTLVLAIAGHATLVGAATTQDFDVPGNAYTLGQHGSGPAATIVSGGHTGNFMRLLSAAAGSLNTLGFERTDNGAFCTVVIDFDYRITRSGTGVAEGFSVSLLDAAAYDESGVTEVGEEPDLAGSVGVGFDTHVDGGELNDNHVSIHFDGSRLMEADATPILDLDGTSGSFAHAQILISSDDTGGSVTVTLTPPGGSPAILVNALAVPALRPYEGRLHFGARAGSGDADHDLDNVRATYTGCPSILGAWGRVQPWPVVAVHADMLPTGKVLFWDRDDINPEPPYLWDPVTERITSAADPGLDLFCSGHSFLSNGHLFVSGGHDEEDGYGLPYGHIYNPYSDTWSQVSSQMNLGRWYPTNIPLANGEVLVVSGRFKPENTNPLPQIYKPITDSWRDLTGAVLVIPLYSMMHLAPDGTVVNVGPAKITQRLDMRGTGSWTILGRTGSVTRGYGSSVQYDHGHILLMGGGDPPTDSTQVLDLNEPSPAWRFVDSMAYARRQLNATILADGSVLVTGGTREVGFNEATGAVFAAEAWDPSTEAWKTLAGAQIRRIYHSHALLLPDGRVLTGGGGHPDGGSTDSDHFDSEVYSPPYLFRGPRPVIDAAPSQITYSTTFSIETPDAGDISAVHLIRLSAVTHSFNQNQRFTRLSFSKGTSEVVASTPSNQNLAPPGHYMLFILDGNKVPSVSKLVQLIAASLACGDVDANGVVNQADVDTFRLYLADQNGASVGEAHCNTIGSVRPCDILDVTVLARAVHDPPLPPGVAPICRDAVGPVVERDRPSEAPSSTSIPHNFYTATASCSCADPTPPLPRCRECKHEK